MGKNWGVRWIVPTGSIRPDEWKLFSREFTAEAKHVGPDGTWMLRFNIEGMARLGMIDRVSLVPLEGEVEEGETAAAPAAVITRMPATDNIDTFAADIVFSGLERPETWEAVLTVADSAGKKHRIPAPGTPSGCGRQPFAAQRDSPARHRAGPLLGGGEGRRQDARKNGVRQTAVGAGRRRSRSKPGA